MGTGNYSGTLAERAFLTSFRTHVTGIVGIVADSFGRRGQNTHSCARFAAGRKTIVVRAERDFARSRRGRLRRAYRRAPNDLRSRARPARRSRPFENPGPFAALSRLRDRPPLSRRAQFGR